MKTFKKAPIAVAIASLMISGSVFAWGGWNPDPTPPVDPPADEQTGFEASSNIESTVTNTKTIGVEHDTEFSSDISVEGDIRLWGKGYSYAGALTDSKQINSGNEVNNNQTDSDAAINGGAFQGASGNIGANVAGGDNNQQANDAALATTDANMVFARATSASFQSSSGNATDNQSTSNSAGLSGGAFNWASGNIAVNAAAGAGNSQQNAFSAAVGNGGSAEAVSVGVQQSYDNVTNNDLAEVTVKTFWGTNTIDGAPVSNNAYLGGGAFQNASGNIGVNVASGSGNMQRNSLSVAAAASPTN